MSSVSSPVLVVGVPITGTPGAPSTNNQVVDTLQSVINNAIMNVAIPAAIVAIDAEVPFLADPGVSEIVKLALDWMAGYVVNAMNQIAALAVIDIQTSAEAAAYQGAYQQLAVAFATGDPNAIAAAQKNFQTALGNLIHWDGS